MVNSNTLKKFIIRYYLDHSITPIKETAFKLSAHLEKHFLPQEIVRMKATGQRVKVISNAQDIYTVEVDGSTEKMAFSDLKREESLSSNNIYKFLEANTKISPFGRILRNNVLKEINKPTKEENEIVIINKEMKPRKKEESNLGIRNFTANEFLKNQNEKSFFSKREILNDDTSKDAIYTNHLIYKDTKENRSGSFSSKEAEVRKKEPIEIINSFNTKKSNESEILTLKIKELLKKFTFTHQNEEQELLFKHKINMLLDSRIIRNHPNEVLLKRKLIELLSNPSSQEIMNFKVNELFKPQEKKILKIEERIDFLEILKKEEYEEIKINDILCTELFIEVYFFFFFFRKHFNFEMGLDEFKKAIENDFYSLMKDHLEMVQEEYKTASKSQFKSMVENALNIVVKKTGKEGIDTLKKYDWAEVTLSIYNVKSTLDAFYSFVYNVLNLEKVSYLKEDSSLEGRLLNMKFIIQCCYSTNKFRQIINLIVEENRLTEKKKIDLSMKLKELRSKKELQPSEEINEEIKAVEKEIGLLSIDLLTTGYKAEIIYVDGCLFLFFNGVCFWRENKFYRMSNEQVIRLIDRLGKDNRFSNCFSSILKCWLDTENK